MVDGCIVRDGGTLRVLGTLKRRIGQTVDEQQDGCQHDASREETASSSWQGRLHGLVDADVVSAAEKRPIVPRRDAG